MSSNGSIYGEKFWYQFIFGMASIVTMFGACLTANLAQCRACWAVSWGCTKPMSFHLYSKALPKDLNILPLSNEK